MAYYKGIQFFEALLASNKLLKDSNMNNHDVNLGDQIILNLGDLYDIIVWKNNFNISLNDNFVKLNNWLNDGNVHSVNNLLKAFKKFSNIKINCFENRSAAFEKVQYKYGNEVIDKKMSEAGDPILKIKNYFFANWEKSMLICKNFDFNAVFNIPELKLRIVEELLDLFIIDMSMPQRESVQIVELTGEDA